jgi:CsoR family transcriptional regulator, copper-sensing transcriptional repressor
VALQHRRKLLLAYFERPLATKKHAEHDPVDHTRQIPRLRRIEGQVRGLQQMIHDGRYCLDVINQAGAVISSLRRIQSDMLRDHLGACARVATTGQFTEREREQMADEVA